MGKQIEKLSALAVSRAKKKGYYADGNNLYLQVVASGAKTWIFRYMLNGKSREMGLGAVHAVTLAEAREKAVDCRKLLASGIDPLAARDAAQSAKKMEEAKAQTFQQCAEAYIASHKDAWRNAKHVWQWENTMERFAYPVIGDLPVQEVDVALVLKILEPIWKTKTETATRVRGRIELILDYAKSKELFKGENPARWRGHLQNLLAKPSKIRKVKHQPALPYAEINDFLTKLKAEEGTASPALAFAILTATRTSETLKAQWQEFDLKAKLWSIPYTRMKAGREHRVPLSEAAIAILKDMQKQQKLLELEKCPYVFTTHKAGKPMSNMAMLMLLRRMNRKDITVHGFRSTFRDWAAEQTHYPREVAETALAHISGDRVELAYRRSDLFDKRRQMMDAWARYCSTPAAKAKTGGKVVKLVK